MYQFLSHQSVISFSLISHFGQNHLVKKIYKSIVEKSSLYENTHHHENFFMMAILHCSEEKKEYRRMIRKRENRGRDYSSSYSCFTNPLPKSDLSIYISQQIFLLLSQAERTKSLVYTWGYGLTYNLCRAGEGDFKQVCF